MDMQRLLTSLSTRILVQFVIVVAAAIVLLAINFDVVRPFYFENQLTNTGIVINSAILLLLLIGLGNICWHLLRYWWCWVIVTPSALPPGAILYLA